MFLNALGKSKQYSSYLVIYQSSHIVLSPSNYFSKPQGSTVHFSVTTYEPYGVCCCQGLKVSLLMHNFGEKRWGQGIVDDIRSTNDQNTRIVGDFTKMVRSYPIARKMKEKMETENWKMHFHELVKDHPELSETENDIVPKLIDATADHSKRAPSFRRKTLRKCCVLGIV